MGKPAALSELQRHYLLGKIDKRECEGLIFQYLLDNFEKFRQFGGDRERWIDFVTWLYPRLSRAVEGYRETGASFEAYINAIVQWSCKEYRIKEADHEATEYACWKARAEELEIREAEPGYTAAPAASQPLSRIYSKRQILILFLKSYYFVSDDFTDAVAAGIGMEKRELYRLVDELKKLRIKREHAILVLKERIHCQYYRCLAFEKRLHSATPGTAYYDKMGSRFGRARLYLEAAKHRLAGIRMDATNWQIAAVLHIPKGTIDSALHSIREKSKKAGLF
jgi:DNA-directed RNA polymerase specialized sigma24 family protein